MDSPQLRGTPRQRDKNRYMTQQIHELQDERTEQQKRVFTKWVNAVLAQLKRGRTLEVKDLYEEIKDGDILLDLLYALRGVKLWKQEAGRFEKSNIQCRVKIEEALKYIEHNHVRLVNVTVSSIIDGNPKIILGLVWQIILHFQITEAISHVPPPASTSASGVINNVAPSTDDVGNGAVHDEEVADRNHNDQRIRLLAWVQDVLARDPGRIQEVEVTDFGKSWRDGKAFSVLVLNLSQDRRNNSQQEQQQQQYYQQKKDEETKEEHDDLQVASESEKKKKKKTTASGEDEGETTRRTSLQSAFSAAEVELGVARLLEPEDVDVENPDERPIMMYVAQFAKLEQQRQLERILEQEKLLERQKLLEQEKWMEKQKDLEQQNKSQEQEVLLEKQQNNSEQHLLESKMELELENKFEHRPENHQHPDSATNQPHETKTEEEEKLQPALKGKFELNGNPETAFENVVTTTDEEQTHPKDNVGANTESNNGTTSMEDFAGPEASNNNVDQTYEQTDWEKTATKQGGEKCREEGGAGRRKEKEEDEDGDGEKGGRGDVLGQNIADTYEEVERKPPEQEEQFSQQSQQVKKKQVRFSEDEENQNSSQRQHQPAALPNADEQGSSTEDVQHEVLTTAVADADLTVTEQQLSQPLDIRYFLIAILFVFFAFLVKGSWQ